MLILRRKSGESIVVGDNITLTVLDINEGSVRLAIDAPKTIPILRSELLQAADANRASAAGERPSSLFRLLGERPGKAQPGRLRPLKPGAPGRASHASADVPADRSDAPAPSDGADAPAS